MSAQKIIGYTLAIIVLIVTVIAILGIWDIIDLQNVTAKLIKSLVVVFLSSVIVLFIYGVVLKDNDK